MTVTLPTFEYSVLRIKDLEVVSTISPEGAIVVDHIKTGGKILNPSRRFWDSLCARFGFGPSIFKYFSHAEVFQRISEKSSKDMVRLAVQMTPYGFESPKDWKPKLLALSSPKGKAVLTNTDMIQVFEELPLLSMTYHDGIVTSTHPCRNVMSWDIEGATFTSQLMMETPLDGYGKPTVWLSVAKELGGEDGVTFTAYSKKFRSGIILGDKSAAFTLKRAVESFSNEDGFVALKQRMEAATNSWSSVSECVRLTRILYSLKNSDFNPDYALTVVPNGVDSLEGTLRNRLISALHEITGDIRTLYGVAQLDSISEKKMKLLPTKCRMFTLMDFATDIATRQVLPEAARRLRSYFGELISNEYDLESSGEKFGSFQDFVDKSEFKKEAV
jgi:hypothetical protein